MGKFRNSAQNSAFRGKLWSLTNNMTVAASYTLVTLSCSTDLSTPHVLTSRHAQSGAKILTQLLNMTML